MLKEYFPSPAKLKLAPPVVEDTSSFDLMSDEEWTAAFNIRSQEIDTQGKGGVGVTTHDVLVATKMGLSVEVYQQRCREVVQASNECSFMIGDTGYPVLAKDKKYGKCMVVGICRHYDNYGTVDWNDPPFILSVSPLNDKASVIQCTGGWLVKKEENNEC
jgi:hypothetical protein